MRVILFGATGMVVLLRAFPQFVTTTEQVGRAMLRVARQGSPGPVLETRDINALQ